MTLPGHGETVGEAYIRILADGSGLPGSIRDEFDSPDNDRAFRDAGKGNRDKYKEGFDEETKKKPLWARDIGELKKSHGRFNAVGRFLGGDTARGFREALERELGDKALADRIHANIARATLRSSDINTFTKAYKDIGPHIAQALEQIRQEENKARIESAKTNKQRVRDLAATVRKLSDLERARFDTIHELSSSAARRDRADFTREVQRLTAQALTGDRTAKSRLERLHSETNALIRDGEHGFLRMDGRIKQGVRSASDMERAFQRVHNKVNSLDIGKFFGKGSRNNFFNAIGSVAGAVSRLGVKMALLPVESFVRLRANLRNANGPMEKMGVLMGTVGRVGGKLVGVLAGIGGALNLVVLFAGPLASLLSMLGGIITALASTIGFGLIGAIGGLLPIMGALASAAVVVAIAFGGMNKAQKDILKVKLKPVIKEFQQLRNETRKALFSNLPEFVKAARKNLRLALPIFRGVAEAVGQALTGALDVLSGPRFRKNLDAMLAFFPHAIRKIGIIGTNAFVGIGNVLRALVPLANHFLDIMVKSTRAFADFSGNTDGQQRIEGFFNRAFRSAQSLWRFTKALSRVIGDIASRGRVPGNNLFDAMTKGLNRFDKFLHSGAGRTALDQWFKDTQKFAHALGQFAGGFVRLFDALDSQTSRQIINSLLTGLGRLFDFIGNLVPDIQRFQTQVGRLLEPILKILGPLSKILLGALADGLRILADIIEPIATGFQHLVKWLGPAGQGLRLMVGPIVAVALAMKGLNIIMGISLVSRFGALFGNTLLANRIGVWGLGVRQAITNQRAAIGRAVAGLAIALGGISAGRSMGGSGGIAVAGASGALGGALVGSAFGPWGTAIGGVIGGITGVISAWGKEGKAAEDARDRAVAAIKQQKDAALGLAESIAAFKGNIKGPNIAEVDKGLGKTQLSTFDPTQALGSGGQKVSATALDIGDKAGISLKLMRQAALGGQGALDKVTAALGRAAGAGKITGTESGLVALALTDLQDRAQEAEIAFEKQARSTGDLAFAFVPLSREAKKYGNVLDNTAFGTRNAFVIRAQGEAIAKVATAHVKNGNAAILAAGKLFKNENALRKSAVAAGYNSGKVNELTEKYYKLPKSVSTLLKKTGVTPEQIREITDHYHKIPKDWLTKVTKKGVTPAQIQAITDRYLHIPPTRSTTIGVGVATRTAAQQISDFISSQNGRTITLGVVSQKFAASGTILNRATQITAGEAGPEAIVPLRRPLNQVDPSVRALSAFAQGLGNGGQQKMARGGVVGSGKTVNVEAGAIVIHAPITDPHAAATLVIDQAATIGGYS